MRFEISNQSFKHSWINVSAQNNRRECSTEIPAGNLRNLKLQASAIKFFKLLLWMELELSILSILSKFILANLISTDVWRWNSNLFLNRKMQLVPIDDSQYFTLNSTWHKICIIKSFSTLCADFMLVGEQWRSIEKNRWVISYWLNHVNLILKFENRLNPFELEVLLWNFHPITPANKRLFFDRRKCSHRFYNFSLRLSRKNFQSPNNLSSQLIKEKPNSIYLETFCIKSKSCFIKTTN